MCVVLLTCGAGGAEFVFEGSLGLGSAESLRLIFYGFCNQDYVKRIDFSNALRRLEECKGLLQGF